MVNTQRADFPVIVACARTPFGRFEGALAPLSAPRLGAITLDEVMVRATLDPGTVDAVYAGIGMLSGATLTATRQAVLLSNLPSVTPSLTVDRACCSGMTAVGLASKDIRLRDATTVLCGGFENLSQAPLLWPRQRSRRPAAVTVEDPLLLRAPVVDRPIAVYTGDESIAQGIDRAQQDAWAIASHQKYLAADTAGYFDFERFPVRQTSALGAPIELLRDESPRADTTMERLAALKPIHGGKTVTAGNAPGLNDGAAFLLVMQAQRAQETDHPILARILGYTQVAGGPTSGTSTPAVAIQSLLARHDMTANDLDLIEINEAYAATPLVSTLVLADGDRERAEVLRHKTNVHGGAVAVGHPLGASGARLVMTLIAGLRARGGGRGVAAICGGFGQGDAILVEV